MPTVAECTIAMVYILLGVAFVNRGVGCEVIPFLFCGSRWEWVGVVGLKEALRDRGKHMSGIGGRAGSLALLAPALVRWRVVLGT